LDSTLKANLSKPDNTKFNFGYNTKKLDSLIATGADKETQMKAMGIDENAGWFERMMYKQMLKFHEREGGDILQTASDTLPIAMFFLLPMFAFILKIFYWKRGRYSHHLVFSFYYFSFLFVVMTFVLGINYFFYDIPDWIDWLIVLSTFIYLWLSMKRFYQQGYFITLIKAGMSTFIYGFLLIFATIGLVFAAILIY
jgi:hypothetical protein